MPIPRMTPDAVLKMVHAQIHRYQGSSLAQQDASPEMRQAIGQVWELVKQRLGHSKMVQEIDEIIVKMTSTMPAGRDQESR